MQRRLPWAQTTRNHRPGAAQNRLAARRRLPAVPIFNSVKLNRSDVSLRTEPNSYFRTSTLNPQQSQLYEPCSAPYCTNPVSPPFKSSPTFAATPSPALVGDPYPSSSRNWLKFEIEELTPSVKKRPGAFNFAELSPENQLP